MEKARQTGPQPACTYSELEGLVRSVGLEPWQVINFNEEKWIAPSPRNAAHRNPNPNPNPNTNI